MTEIYFGISYFAIGIILFAINLLLFELITPFSVKNEIFQIQNKAVGKIVKGQLIGQGIMIGSVIYYLGLSYQNNLDMSSYYNSLISIIGFGFVGIVLFQFSLYIMSKIMPFEKEIVVEMNESLAGIIEGFLIAISIIISVSLYS